MNEPKPSASFDPEHTGRRLPSNLRPVWVEFCTRVFREHPKLYNTWFENRYGRDRGWGGHDSDMLDWRVRAEARGDMVTIHCPGKNGKWAEKFNELIYGELRDIPRPKMYAKAMQ